MDNLGEKTVSFEIIVTPESIKNDLSQFLAAGLIKKELVNSLMVKLDITSNRNCQAGTQIYQSFIKELTGLSGKGVDPLHIIL